MKNRKTQQRIPILQDIVDKNLARSAKIRSQHQEPKIDERPNSAAIEMIVNRVLLKYLPKIRQELIAELNQLNIKEKPSE
ncbi:MAG: hypothetical protein Q9N68_00185 [Gammaproteobacteria bacterium]|nr:hypothetical protein [Gammaproteobacteria bacterium]